MQSLSQYSTLCTVNKARQNSGLVLNSLTLVFFLLVSGDIRDNFYFFLHERVALSKAFFGTQNLSDIVSDSGDIVNMQELLGLF